MLDSTFDVCTLMSFAAFTFSSRIIDSKLLDEYRKMEPSILLETPPAKFGMDRLQPFTTLSGEFFGIVNHSPTMTYAFYCCCLALYLI
jgi:hypothetical protein